MKILTTSTIVIDTHKTVFNSLVPVPVPVPFPFPDSMISIRPKFNAIGCIFD